VSSDRRATLLFRVDPSQEHNLARTAIQVVRGGASSAASYWRYVSFLSMRRTGSLGLQIDFRRQLRAWGLRWELRDLHRSVTVEWTRRFRRALGRVHLERRVVRLSSKLAKAPNEILLEVLCHEVAHLAVGDLYGRRCQPHGREWAALVRAAGFEPQSTIPWPPPLARPASSTTIRRRYVHRCFVCHVQRTAWRPVRQWRCAACRRAGLDGRLEISADQSRAHA
jgi:predicted SprT family Zn-dependent metalloprotease